MDHTDRDRRLQPSAGFSVNVTAQPYASLHHTIPAVLRCEWRSEPARLRTRDKWLQAIYLIGASKKGISAHQLHRMMGVTYRSAWFMMHRLRYAMSVEPLSKLAGTVEIDETFIGGKRKAGKGRRPADGARKPPVVALVERSGRVKAMPMERVDAQSISALVLQHVDQLNTSALMTDDAPHFPQKIGRIRQSVNHTRGEYVRGDVHTNTAEGFFSLLKRGITGTFHHVG